MTPKQFQIANAIQDGHRTVSAIANALDMKSQAVRMTLRHMERDEIVREGAAGVFRLTEAGSRAVSLGFGYEPEPVSHEPELEVPDFASSGQSESSPNPKSSMEDYIKEHPIRSGCLAVAALMFLITGIWGCNSIDTIEPGDVGVRTSWGALHEKVYPNDWYFVWPWEELTHCNVQAFPLTVNAPPNGMQAAVTKDKQALGYELNVTCQYNPGQVWRLYKHFGRDPKLWPATIVAPLVPHCFKTVSSQRTLDEAISDRTRLASDTAALLAELLEEKLKLKDPQLSGAITINQVTIPSLGYSQEYQAVIEKTQRVQEEIREQRNQLVRYMVEQARSVVAAEAEQQADIARSTGRALSKIIEFEAELTRVANLVRLGVDPNQIYTWDRLSEIAGKWNGELPKFMNGGGEEALPLRIPLEAVAGDREITEANIELMLEGVQSRRAQLEQSLRDLRAEQRALREALMEATSNPHRASELLPENLREAVNPDGPKDGATDGDSNDTENPGGSGDGNNEGTNTGGE